MKTLLRFVFATVMLSNIISMKAQLLVYSGGGTAINFGSYNAIDGIFSDDGLKFGNLKTETGGMWTDGPWITDRQANFTTPVDVAGLPDGGEIWISLLASGTWSDPISGTLKPPYTLLENKITNGDVLFRFSKFYMQLDRTGVGYEQGQWYEHMQTDATASKCISIDGTTHLFVGQIKKNGANLDLTVFLFAQSKAYDLPLTAPTTTASYLKAVKTTSCAATIIPSIDFLKFDVFAGDGSNTIKWHFDEIRIAKSWAEAVPLEPKPAFLSVDSVKIVRDASSNFSIKNINLPQTVEIIGTPLPLGLEIVAGADNNSRILTGKTSVDAGEYLVTLKATNTVGADVYVSIQDFKIIVTNPKPVINCTENVIDATVGNSIVKTFSATNTPTTWSFQGLPTGVSQVGSSASITGKPTTEGITTVNVYAENSGGLSAACQVQINTAPSGLAEDLLQLVNVLPNPASEYITITLPTHLETANVSIMDCTGKIVLTKSVHNANSTINISTLAQGIYFVSVKALDFNKTMKLVVK